MIFFKQLKNKNYVYPSNSIINPVRENRLKNLKCSTEWSTYWISIAGHRPNDKKMP